MASRNTSYLFVGDSHMEALGPRLQSLLPGHVGHVAHRGWSVRRYARERILERARWPRQPYDVVAIELGGNDGVEVPSMEQHFEDMKMVLLQLSDSGAIGRGTEIYWFGPAVADSTRTDHDAIAEMQKRLAPRLGVKWIDSRPLTRKDELRSDRLHFTGAGYDRWASNIEKKVTGSGAGLMFVIAGAAVAVLGVASAMGASPFGRVDELALDPIRIKKARNGRVDVVTERGVFEMRRREGEWWITFPGKAQAEAASKTLEDAVAFVRAIE